MVNKRLNTNKQFMIGNGILAFAVLVIVAIFIYISFRFKDGKVSEERYKEIYAIEIADELKGEDMTITINDSTFFKGVVSDENKIIMFNRFDETTTIMVSAKESNNLFTSELSTKGGKYIISKKEGEIVISK